ncbi:hypothetical protein K503DRAFT_631602 [Rhizopogon vinicolor AM-OR11-026]|uniref:Uncharacterized protein n=1 Tax=Rhizopogon vinicolor AM-OR11-026 TaxID=1314800 RepID=A0A1B7N606_9AGAM|nr:hypothetical protein K503DRAFT_631602 [Rhizopogon vinicolor AM-OR11-026]
MQERSVDSHRKSNRHKQQLGDERCPYRKPLSRSDSLKRHIKTCKQNQEESIGCTPVTDEPGSSTASGSTTMAPTPVAVPSRPFTLEASRPGPSPMPLQAPPPLVSAENLPYARVPSVPVSTQAMSMLPIQPATQAPRVQPRAVPQVTSWPPPLPVFAQATSILPVQPATQVPRAGSSPVVQTTWRPPPPPVIAQDFFIMGWTPQPQQASGVHPPPVVAGDSDISTDATEEDDMDDLFDSPEMSSPEMSTSLTLPPAPAVQETAADAPAAADAPFSFDLAALDLPFDNWMDSGEQSLPDAFADPESWMS